MLASALLVLAASSDPRAALAPGDLSVLLQARGMQCDGCSTSDMVSKLQETDHIAENRAVDHHLTIMLRYCAS